MCRFQVAASNSPFGPFNFVGPDNTAATFFTTSGAALGQFDGNRYLQYRAYLSTTDSTKTPTLNDVTVCFTDPCIPPPTPTVTPGGPTEFCAGGSVTLGSSSATGNQWFLDGNPIGGATSQQFLVSSAGAYTDIVTNALSCASAASTATTVTVDPPPPTPTISADTNGTGTQDQACPEQPLTLHANGATGATSYQWFQDNNTLNGETASTTQATGVGHVLRHGDERAILHDGAVGRLRGAEPDAARAVHHLPQPGSERDLVRHLPGQQPDHRFRQRHRHPVVEGRRGDSGRRRRRAIRRRRAASTPRSSTRSVATASSAAT